MSPAEFDTLTQEENKELLCHAVHDESGDLHEKGGVAALHEVRRTAYAVEVFFALTCNGGFQALVNGPYDWTVPYSVAALRAVELPQYAEVFERALTKWFPHGIPEEPDAYYERIDVIYEEFLNSKAAEDHEEPFGAEEGAFWTSYFSNRSEFRDRLHTFIVENKESFVS